MTAASLKPQYITVGGQMLWQRPGIDPVYDGPTADAYADTPSDLQPTNTQIAAIERVLLGSSDPYPVWRSLSRVPYFAERYTYTANAPAKVIMMPTVCTVTGLPAAPVTVDRYAINARPYPLRMPEDAMYGILGTLARSMQCPLGWAYCAVIPLYAGQGINLHDPSPRIRGTVYCALLGGSGDGKSVVMRRAQEVLSLTHEDVETNVAASDRGILTTFRRGLDRKDPAEPLSGGVLVMDEMITLLNKMAIQGSTLQQIMCELWSQDRIGVSDKFGDCSINTRVSLLGKLKLADRDEFAARFAGNTQDGFYNRMILATGPSEWRWDHSWEPPTADIDTDVNGDPIMSRPVRPLNAVSVPKAAYEQGQAWEDAHRANGIRPGRLTEMAYRVALITASANGDTTITEACLAAALRFADWQMAVRGIYAAGEGVNDDAILTGMMLDAFAEVEKAHLDGKPKTVGGRPIVGEGGWVNFRLFQQSRSWARKYGASAVNRVIQNLRSTHQVENLFDDDAKKPTNKYRLCR